MSRAHKRPIESLGNILPKVIQGMQRDPRPSLEEVQEIWERLAGREAAQHSWPRRLSGKRLTVEVENSGWMYTLNLKKPSLLQGLMEQLGENRVEELAFRIGEKKDA